MPGGTIQINNPLPQGVTQPIEGLSGVVLHNKSPPPPKKGLHVLHSTCSACDFE